MYCRTHHSLSLIAYPAVGMSGGQQGMETFRLDLFLLPHAASFICIPYASLPSVFL